MITTNGTTRAAVTGAGGSLGRALVAHLLDAGTDVVALVRNERDERELQQMGARAVRGDMLDHASLKRLVDGAGVVYHLAAWMGSPAKPELARRINVDGSARLVRAAAEAGATRVVVASSIAVHGPVRSGVIDEDAPLWRVGDAYGDSKIEMEEVVGREAKDVGIELVVLRPTMIYGPGSPSWTMTPFGAIERGLPMIFGDGSYLLDAVYVDDVARAFHLAGVTPEAAGEAFTIGGQTVDWNAFFGAYARMAGTSVRRIPASLAWSGARAAATVTKAVLGKPKVIPELLGVMTSRATFAKDKAKRVLGYEAEVSLEDGMKRTEAYLRAIGRIRSPLVALVTGAGSGLGQAVVRGLLERELTVYATDVDTGLLAELASAGAYAVALDVTSDESVDAARDEVLANGHGVDLIVNVAGILRPGALEAQRMEDVEIQFQVNALGPLRVARAFAPAMRERGWGRIVNVSSTNGFLVTPFMGAYSASKYALEALSDSLRLEMKPFGVEVAVVQPGAMKTPFANRAKDALRREIERSPEAWRPHLEAFLNGSLWGENTATEPKKVAKAVVNAALGRRLRARTYGTLDAVPTRAMAMMPDMVKDAFFTNAAGLRRKKG